MERVFGKFLSTVSAKAKRNFAEDLIHGTNFTSKYTDYCRQYKLVAIKEYKMIRKVTVLPWGIVATCAWITHT